MKKLLSYITFGSTLFVSLSACAIPGDLEITGFLSVVTSWTDASYLTSGVEPVYVSSIGKRPSFDRDSNVGVQFTKQLRPDLDLTVQLLGRGVAQFDVEATWGFLKWEPNDNWQFRAGRVRTSPYMLSDYLDVGYAYPWVRPPVEVYSQIPNSFSNFTGADVRYKREICKRDLSLTAFYGANTGHLNFPAIPGTEIFDTIKLKQRDIGSFSVKFGDEVFSVRAGYETAMVTLFPSAGTIMDGLNSFLNAYALTPGFLPGVGFTAPIGADYINYFSAYNSRFTFMGIGYQFDWNNVVSMAELVKRHAATPIIANAIGWYWMGGYRVKQFLPHVTFARERLVDSKGRQFNSVINGLFTSPLLPAPKSPKTLDEVAQELIYTSQFYDGGAGAQTSVTVGLRWDIYQGVAIKAEYQRVHPDNNTPGLFDFNPGKSVNVYSLAIDAVM